MQVITVAVVGHTGDQPIQPSTTSLMALSTTLTTAFAPRTSGLCHLVVLTLHVLDVHVGTDVVALLTDLVEGFEVPVVDIWMRHVEPLSPRVPGT